MKMGMSECEDRDRPNFPPKYIIQIVSEEHMSSKIILDNISVKNNPSSFLDSIEFDITFTAIEPIPSLLEWKIIYVGSAKNEQYDQVLEQFEIGPILEASTMNFSVDCSPPDYLKIPRDELICVTAIIITISFKDQEFIRVGYYVHNVLNAQITEDERSNASVDVLIGQTKRTILTDKPRITKFRVNWGDQMKEETNNNHIKVQKLYDSNNSLLANKIGSEQHQNQEKQSTREEKDQNSRSIMKSQLGGEVIGEQLNSNNHSEQEEAVPNIE